MVADPHKYGKSSLSIKIHTAAFRQTFDQFNQNLVILTKNLLHIDLSKFCDNIAKEFVWLDRVKSFGCVKYWYTLMKD